MLMIFPKISTRNRVIHIIHTPYYYYYYHIIIRNKKAAQRRQSIKRPKGRMK